MITNIIITVEDIDRRLDAVIRDRLSWPQAKIQRGLRTKDIRCNDKKTTADYRTRLGDTLRIYEGEGTSTKPTRETPRPMNLSRADIVALKAMVLFEDEGIIILNKPANLASQGGSGITHALDQMMVAWWEKEGFAGQPRLIHRLDRPTTGVLIMAKTRAIAEALSKQIRTHTFEKTYEAIVYGVPYQNSGVIEEPLLAEKGFVRIDTAGQEAETHWRVLRTFGDSLSHIELRPKQGRMHQLRVHCTSMGHSIVGDRKYGRPQPLPLRLPAGLHLHARSVTFENPTTGQQQTITAPLLDPMRQSFDALWDHKE